MCKSSDFLSIKSSSSFVEPVGRNTSVENDEKLNETMKDKDKLFIVVYINVDKLNSSIVRKKLFHNWKDYMDSNFDDSVRSIIVPSDKNEIEFFSLQNAQTVNLKQLLELQNRLEIKNNSLDEREERKIRGSFSD